MVLVVWVIALTAVCVRVTVQTKRHKHSGYFVYVDAGRAWRTGGHLYTSLDDLPPGERQRLARQIEAAGDWQVRENTVWGGYRYSPTAALLFVPLSYMPGPAGEIVWRVFLAAVAIGGLYACARAGIPRPLARRDWPIFCLLVIWAYVGCLNNGQSSCLLLGCLLGAAAACCAERWTLAALLVALATVLKLYPISFGLLLTLFYPRRFGWRFAAALALAFALPFMLRPYAMLEEHRRWIWHLVNDAKTAVPVTSWNQDVRLVLYRLTGITLSMRTFLVVQAAVASGIAALCLAGQRFGWPRRVLVTRALGLAACWMTTFGMATEPSTYILVAPTLAWSLWEAWLRPTVRPAEHAGSSPGGIVSRGMLVAAYLLFVASYIFLWFPRGRMANSYGAEPLAGLLIMAYLVARSLRELRPPARPLGAPAQELALASPG